jgi:hypothetical protein
MHYWSCLRLKILPEYGPMASFRKADNLRSRQRDQAHLAAVAKALLGHHPRV